MIKILFKALLISILLFSFISASAQDEDEKEFRKNTVYLELLGNGGYYSLNYDRIFEIKPKIKISTRIGFTYFPDLFGNGFRQVGPLTEVSILYSLFNNKHFLELGSGLSYFHQGYMINPGYTYNEAVLFFIPRLGYRFQQPNGGLFFKIGFLPIYEWLVFKPQFFPLNREYHRWYMYGGVAVGYSF